MATAPTLAAEIEQVRAAGYRKLIFDLRDLSFMDTGGLHLLLECDAEARKDGFTVALIAGPPAVQLMFEVTATTTELRFIDP